VKITSRKHRSLQTKPINGTQCIVVPGRRMIIL
jgi:hypothetical protein